ncbi:MAG: beta galactosidase jelly roll domain-containing protein, partial [Bacteroidales bacterium]|nr:beta galactosidase jelly roll domain-containing protein [Bacteroidales bacterium]
MHYRYLLGFAVAVLTLLSSCSEQVVTRQMNKFTKDWRFQLVDSTMTEEGLEAESYDDSNWRILNLPHDWAIEGDFSEDNPSGTGGGALPGGLGWYRKTFDVSADELKKKVFVTFDGVYMNSTVYVNGHELGHRPYGYASFQYELTAFLHEGTNVIAVRVDNTEQPNSRWYSGCGIYRNVWLTKTNDIYVDNWGTFVSTPLVNSIKADVKAQISIVNRRSYNVDVKVVSSIVDKKGHTVASTVNTINTGIDEPTCLEQEFKVRNPHLWNLDDPYRYKMVNQLYAEGVLLDEYTTTFGIRNFYFDPEQGFILNDRNIKINGVCQHHDLGCLGAAVNRRAIERQLQILKQMGCNGIRCAHNPPAPELLELCDSMGFIVMDEAFDMWRKKKTAHDYSRYFNEWHERDLTDLILRDRNHPSVFMWSIGNEVLEQWTHADADTLDLAAANLLLNMKRDDSALANSNELSVNSLLCQKLCRMVHSLDPTRPVTAGNNEPDPNNHLFKAGTLDIIGYNYHDSWFEDVPNKFPHKPFIVTESVSALSTRGYYRMPSDRQFIWPERWDKPFYDPSFACSSYDNCHVPWGNTQEGSWKI